MTEHKQKQLNEKQLNKLVKDAGDWFKTTIIENHIKNTKKLVNPKNFKINRLLARYLAIYYGGKLSAKNIAKTLILPRILGTSITTSMGTNLQNFIPSVMATNFGSAIKGIDIEFIDRKDGKKKYAQLKMGPQTINNDDIKTIHDHFTTIRRTAKTNKLDITLNDLVVCTLYGNESEINGNYKQLRDSHHYPLYIGEEFWERLTGDKEFFDKLEKEFQKQSAKLQTKKMIKNVIKKLANTNEIKELADQFEKITE